MDPSLYKSLGEGLSTIRATEGIRGLSLVNNLNKNILCKNNKAWVPTFFGYSK